MDSGSYHASSHSSSSTLSDGEPMRWSQMSQVVPGRMSWIPWLPENYPPLPPAPSRSAVALRKSGVPYFAQDPSLPERAFTGPSDSAPLSPGGPADGLMPPQGGPTPALMSAKVEEVRAKQLEIHRGIAKLETVQRIIDEQMASLQARRVEVDANLAFLDQKRQQYNDALAATNAALAATEKAKLMIKRLC